MIESSITIAQTLDQKPVHHIDELRTAGSRATTYRIMKRLRDLGYVQTQGRGFFTIRDSIFQPYRIQSEIRPSLQAIRQARYFGKSYNESDVNRAREILRGQVTLDYRAYELTNFQKPLTFFVYVDDIDMKAEELKANGFSEGTKGRVAIMPVGGRFDNEIQRVYLDCLAFGGRNILDAIAIELTHGDKLTVKGEFPIELVEKTRQDLPIVEP